MSIQDNYSVRDYGRMIADKARTAPFVDAMRRTIRPGSTVLDIGSGPGFFSLLACQLGAARVYAIEPDDAIEIGRESARRQAGGERITWLRGFSTEIELPERVDVVIGDLHGTLPFYTGNISSLIDARRRHLKSGGVMIPRRDTVFAAPAETADEYADVSNPWESTAAGVDLTAGRRFVTNQWWRAASAPILRERYLAAPMAWAEVDYRHCESPNASGNCTWAAERAGILHGYYVWFDSETAEGICCSNAPTLPERVYGRAFFPLEQPLAIAEGDSVHGEFAANLVAGEYILRWNTRVADAQGRPKASFAQSTFSSRPVLKEDLDRTRPDYRPSLGEAARVDLQVLDAMTRGETLAEIAARLAREFPRRFKDPAQALRHAADLSLKYSKA
jgi:type I protein arginine methyltransferase